MEYNSPLTIHNLPFAHTHMEVIKPSVLETLNPLVGPCAANARNFFIGQMHLWTFCTKKCAKILKFSGSFCSDQNWSIQNGPQLFMAGLDAVIC